MYYYKGFTLFLSGFKNPLVSVFNFVNFFTVVLYFIKKLARKSDLTRYLLSWLHAFVS